MVIICENICSWFKKLFKVCESYERYSKGTCTISLIDTFHCTGGAIISSVLNAGSKITLKEIAYFRGVSTLFLCICTSFKQRSQFQGNY